MGGFEGCGEWEYKVLRGEVGGLCWRGVAFSEGVWEDTHYGCIYVAGADNALSRVGTVNFAVELIDSNFEFDNKTVVTPIFPLTCHRIFRHR